MFCSVAQRQNTAVSLNTHWKNLHEHRVSERLIMLLVCFCAAAPQELNDVLNTSTLLFMSVSLWKHESDQFKWFDLQRKADRSNCSGFIYNMEFIFSKYINVNTLTSRGRPPPSAPPSGWFITLFKNQRHGSDFCPDGWRTFTRVLHAVMDVFTFGAEDQLDAFKKEKQEKFLSDKLSLYQPV